MLDSGRIVVTVRGGMVQDVQFPPGAKTLLVVHDYDVQGEAGLQLGGEGESFFEGLWEPPGSQPAGTGIPAVDKLAESEARRILEEIYRWMYWDESGNRWDPGKELSGADTVQLLCELMPEAPGPGGGP